MRGTKLEERKNIIIDMLDDEFSIAEIAKTCNVTKEAIWRFCNRHGIEFRREIIKAEKVPECRWNLLTMKWNGSLML